MIWPCNGQVFFNEIDCYIYIYFYLFTHVTESFVTERLVTESWGLLLAPPPYFSVSCLKRFPIRQGYTQWCCKVLFQVFHFHHCSVIYTEGFCAQQSLPALCKKKNNSGFDSCYIPTPLTCFFGGGGP